MFFDGRVYLVAARGRGMRRVAGGSRRHGAGLPDAGDGRGVNVAPGQAVARGDVLIMLEAMKMELPITAPRDGRVRSSVALQARRDSSSRA